MNNNTTISIDLAKDIFQVAIFNQAGKQKSNKAVSANKMCEIIAQNPGADIFMEACGSAHFWARNFQDKGHKVGLIPPHFAAHYRNGNKSDHNDTVAIYEASRSSQLHCVQIKTLEQQDIATLHTYREGYKKERNQLSNRIRGFAREYGVNFPLGLVKMKAELPLALENSENSLTDICREILQELFDQFTSVSKLLEKVTIRIEQVAKNISACKRLEQLPSIGWLGASMLYAKLGNGEAFSCGRDASASLGVVPGHSGSGGKIRIGKITKRGDKYLRSLLANGARAVVIHIKDKQDGLSCWIRSLLERKSFNTTVIAVVNKVVRMALAMLKSGEDYRVPVARLQKPSAEAA